MRARRRVSRDGADELLAFEPLGKDEVRYALVSFATESSYERSIDVDVVARVRRFSDAGVVELSPRPSDLRNGFEGLYAFWQEGVEHRAVAYVIPWGKRALVVLALSAADDFWRIDPRVAARVLLHDRGIPGTAKSAPLSGVWQSATAKNLFEAFADGTWVKTSYRGAGMKLRFGAKGDYQLVYLSVNTHGQTVHTHTTETGRYRFDGFTLALNPVERVVETSIKARSTDGATGARSSPPHPCACSRPRPPRPCGFAARVSNGSA